MPLRRREFQFAGMQVLITGAASGIGRAVAVAAAREGARVHLMDRDESPLLAAAAEIRGGGGDVGLVEACDVSDHEAVASMAQRLTASYGAMDVIMNIAGISAWGTVRSMSHQTWRDLIEVNLMGPIHVIEELVPAMIDSGRGGALVNCSSAAGVIGMPWHAAYSASKFGLRGVSEVLRFDLAKHRISVSLVCPGGVRERNPARRTSSALLDLHLPRHSVHPHPPAVVPSGVRRGHEVAQPLRQPPPTPGRACQPRALMTAPRIVPGGIRDLGPLTWAFAKLAGRVTGTEPPAIFTVLGRHGPLFRGWLHFAAKLMPGGERTGHPQGGSPSRQRLRVRTSRPTRGAGRVDPARDRTGGH